MNDQITIRTGEQIDVDIGDVTNIDIDIGDINELDIDIDENNYRNDYNRLYHLPKINETMVIGEKTGTDYYLLNEDDYLTNSEIEAMLQL